MFNKTTGVKSIKLFISALLALVMTLSLCGCGEDKKDNGAADATLHATVAPTEVPVYDEGTYGSRIGEVSDAQDAETFFVCVGKDTSFCTFYAYKKVNGVWEERFVVDGYWGKKGINTDPANRVAGDKTTPAGVYLLGERFGIQAAPEGYEGEYCRVKHSDYWDGNSNSPTYNQHVKSYDMPDDWNPKGSEHLIDYKVSYDYCTMINFNVAPTIPRIGSCIFLHCMYPGETGSSGCISIPTEKMIEALCMMDDSQSYIMVLPDAESFDEYKDFAWETEAEKHVNK